VNLGKMLAATAQRFGGKTAMSMGDRRLSYSDLDKAANRIANALREMGVKKGDRLVILLPNCPEFVTTYFGAARLGAIAVPLDPRFKMDELAPVFQDCRPAIVVSEGATLEPIIANLKRFDHITNLIDIDGRRDGKCVSLSDIMSNSSPEAPVVTVEPSDVAHIAYTSGPTLHPRGVMLTHGGLVRQAAISAEGFAQTEQDVVVQFALPMHHAFGLVVIMMTAVTRGSTVVIVPGLSMDGLLETIEREKATIFMGVPFVHLLLVNKAITEFIKDKLASLRLVGSAGAALPMAVMKQFKQLFNRDVIDFWGMTESTANVTCQSVDGNFKPGSIGKALPGWELKVIDNEGKELPVDRSGEIIVRGPTMKGYYNKPEATARALRNGWLYTGDVGKVDRDGEVFLTGRSKDIIIVKGQNIYPSDIEEVLLTDPRVAEAVVAGAHDETRGETVKAFIVLKPGQTTTEVEMKHLCHEHMADYKVPRQVSFVDSLPRTAEGKIDKVKLIQAVPLN
jgi:long-chain acyl-CoA synthetase